MGHAPKANFHAFQYYLRLVTLLKVNTVYDLDFIVFLQNLIWIVTHPAHNVHAGSAMIKHLAADC